MMRTTSIVIRKPVPVSVCSVVAVAALLAGCSALPNGANGVGNNKPERTVRNEQGVPYEDRIGRHIYAATGLGASWLEPDTSEVPGVDVNDRVNAGGQITLGMDVSRQLSLELHSADLGSAGLSPVGRINYHLHGASALIYAGKQRHNYRRHGLSGYARLGLGMLENSPVGDVRYQKDNATHVLFGAGLEYMTRMGLGVRAEAIAYEEDVRYGQLALIYRTGKRQERKVVEVAKPAVVPQPIAVPAVIIIEPVAPEPIVEPDVCAEFNGVLEGVNFHSDSAELTNEAMVLMDRAAEKLRRCESRQLIISAHTDSVGAEAYNLGLSKRRARSVMLNLKTRGIDVNRMSARAFGETQPIDTNSTPEGRKRNRRVEVIAQ